MPEVNSNLMNDGVVTDEFALVSHLILQTPAPKMSAKVAARAVAENLSARQEPLDYKSMLRDLEEAGDGWHLRDEHVNPERIPETKALLENPNRTRYWSTMKGELKTGFTIAVKGGFNGDMARISSDAGLNPKDGVEIYKVALKRDFIGDKLGHIYVPSIGQFLLEGQEGDKDKGILDLEGSDFIYLNTRPEVNLVDPRKFYQSIGYELVQEDRKNISFAERAAKRGQLSSNDNSSQKAPFKSGAPNASIA